MAGTGLTGPGSLVCSRVLALSQFLATCPQSLCPRAQDAEEPPKLLVLLQQALGLFHILLGVQRPGVMPGTMGVGTISPTTSPGGSRPAWLVSSLQ